MSCPEADQWMAAFRREMGQLDKTETYVVVDCPNGANVLGCKWVFAIKGDGLFKTRIVAQGFGQIEGVDYGKTEAPTSTAQAFRAFLAVVAARGMVWVQFDVKTAFLYANLKEEIYMKPAPGFEAGPGKVWLLLKTLYGLKQSSKEWYEKLRGDLEGLGFKAASSDPCLFIRRSRDGGLIFMLIYVDDGLIAAPAEGEGELEQLLRSLEALYDIHRLGDPEVFLGMDIERDLSKGTISLGQERFVGELVELCGLGDARVSDVPMSPIIQLARGDGQQPIALPYGMLVGKLLWISRMTRPDIAYAVSVLARFMSAPTMQHWEAARMVVRYLKGTITFKLVYGGGASMVLSGWADSDFAKDETSKSRTGMVFELGGAAISWSSRLQATIAQSTTEAEYVAGSEASKDAIWLREMMADLGLSGPASSGGVLPATVIHVDNQSAMTLYETTLVPTRTRHVKVGFSAVKQRVDEGEVAFKWVSTEEQVADILTKALERGKIERFRQGLGLHMRG